MGAATDEAERALTRHVHGDGDCWVAAEGPQCTPPPMYTTPNVHHPQCTPPPMYTESDGSQQQIRPHYDRYDLRPQHRASVRSHRHRSTYFDATADPTASIRSHRRYGLCQPVLSFSVDSRYDCMQRAPKRVMPPV